MDAKNDSKSNVDLELITAYAQMVFCTLKNSATEITPKAIKSEVKMLYEKFENTEVKRLGKLMIKEKK